MSIMVIMNIHHNFVNDYSSDRTDNSDNTFATASLPSTALITFLPSLSAQTDARPVKKIKTTVSFTLKTISLRITQIYNHSCLSTGLMFCLGMSA